MAHAVAFQEQHPFQRTGWDRLVIIGPIKRGCAVKIRRAQFFQRLEEIPIGIFRAIEHQMFKQMRKTCLALGLML